MNVTEALKIIQPLSDGVNPFSGEQFPADSLYQKPEMIRALCFVVSFLEIGAKKIEKRSNLPKNAGKKWLDEESSLLEKEFDTGKSFKELAVMFERTEFGIESRLFKLGKIEQSKRLEDRLVQLEGYRGNRGNPEAARSN